MQAVGGEDALEKLRTHSFDAVVTDLSMPGVDGFTVLPRLGRWTPDSR